MDSLTCPILVVGYKRQSEICLVLNRIIDSGASRIYVSLDGPKQNDPKDVALCESTNQAVQQLAKSFSGDFYISSSEVNLGSAENVIRSLDWFFSHENFGLILEDDCLPDASIFNYISTLRYLLEYPGVWLLSGYRPNVSELNSIDYSLVSVPLSWGWATTAEHWQKMRFFIWANPKGSLLSAFLKGANAVFWGVGSRRAKRGWVDAWDIPLANAMLEYHGSALMPPVNLISNVGTGLMASNTDQPSKFLHSATESWDVKSYPVPGFELLGMRRKVTSRILEEKFILIKPYHRLRPLFTYTWDLLTSTRSGRGSLKSRIGNLVGGITNPGVLPGDQTQE
jgi:hypothetical protein